MAKLSNSSITSYVLSLGKDFKNQHVKTHYQAPARYPGVSGQYYSLKLKAVSSGVLGYEHFIMFGKFINKFKALKKITYLITRPYLNTTKKPAEVRMGKGKGKFDRKVALITPGTFILEIRFKLSSGTDIEGWSKQKRAFLKDCLPMLTKLSSKLPVKTVVVANDL